MRAEKCIDMHINFCCKEMPAGQVRKALMVSFSPCMKSLVTCIIAVPSLTVHPPLCYGTFVVLLST